MIGNPKLSRGGIDRRAFRIAQPVRKGLRQHGRAAEPRAVLWNRAIPIDPQHASREVTANIGIVGKVVLHAVVFRFGQPEAVRAGYQECAIRSEHDAAFRALHQNLDVLQTRVVFAEPRVRHTFHSNRHRAAFRQRFGPDILVEELVGPKSRLLTPGRREVAKVEEAILREPGIQQDVMQTLRGHHFDTRHAGEGRRNHAVRPHDSNGPDALGNQKIVIRQKRQGPRSSKSSRDRLDGNQWRRFCGRRSFPSDRETPVSASSEHRPRTDLPAPARGRRTMSLRPTGPSSLILSFAADSISQSDILPSVTIKV